MVRTLTLLLLAALSSPAQDVCRNGLFAQDQDDLRLARITAGDRAFFLQDTSAGCPQKGTGCRKDETVDPGAEVLVSKVRNGFACGWQTLDASGWLPASRLDMNVPFDRNPPASAWVGNWRFFDNHIDISLTPDGKRLIVKGSAFWKGLNSTHEGSFEAEGAPSANHLALKDEGCQVRLTIVNKRVAASDNSSCGGANVRFNGVYDLVPAAIEARASSSMKYGHTPEGQETVDITNVSFELAQTGSQGRLILRKTHTEQNVIGNMGNEPKITVEAWPLGTDPKQKPLYAISLDGQDATVVDDALLVIDRTQETPWWSVFHLGSGKRFFDTYAPVVKFSLTEVVQTPRYAGLEIPGDDIADKRLKAANVVGVLTYADEDEVRREALITCDVASRAQLLRSFADTSFELAAVGKALRITLTPFDPAGHTPPTVMMIPVVNDDLDLAHARLPTGVHVAAWKR